MRTSFSISTFRLPAQRAGAGFFVATGALASLLIAITVGINWWIDPFDKLGRNWIGFYASKEREAKISWLGARSYEGVLLGSSKAAYIDPLDLDRPGLFNASFPLAVPEEMLELVRGYVAPGQVVLIGLDLYMFNEREFPWQPSGLIDTRSPLDLLRYLLSGRVLIYSLRDLGSHFAGGLPRLAAAGNVIATPRRQRHEAMAERDYQPVLDMLTNYHFADFQFSERRVAALSELRDLLASRSNPYVAFINPLNREVLRLLATLPAAQSAFERFRDEVRAVFPDVVDLADSRWSDPELYFRFDPYHYLPEVGAAFTNQEILPLLADRRAGESGRGIRPDRPEAVTGPSS